MKQIAIRPTLTLKRWGYIWVIIFGLLSFFTSDALAQEPTAIPTPTPAATWTPESIPTNTPPPVSSASPTPTSPTATPSGRLVDFRVDGDKIDLGDCVLFSWVVRGDIDRIEFDKKDDDKEPLLVSDMDSREECPEEDSRYKLIVRWLDGTETISEIKIEVDTSNSDSSGSSGGGSSSGSSSSGGDGSTTPGEVGEFVPVTPILFATDTPVPEIVSAVTPKADEISVQPAAFESPTDGQLPKPSGLLESVKTLPETGMRPTSISAMNNLMATSFSLILVLGSAGSGLVLLIWLFLKIKNLVR